MRHGFFGGGTHGGGGGRVVVCRRVSFESSLSVARRGDGKCVRRTVRNRVFVRYFFAASFRCLTHMLLYTHML